MQNKSYKPMKTRIILLSLLLIVSISQIGSAQNYTVIQVDGKCQVLANRQWNNVYKGTIFNYNATLKNISANLADVKLSFREIDSQNHYTISFKDSIHVHGLSKFAANELPSRFSSISVDKISSISKKEIAANRPADFFRDSDNDILSNSIDAMENGIADGILSRLDIQEDNIVGITNYANDPLISMMTTKSSGSVLITNYSETGQYMFVLQIGIKDRVPVKAVSGQYIVDPMSETVIELDSNYSTGNMTLLVATSKSIDVDVLITLLNQKIDFPANESKTEIGLSPLVKI